MNDKKKMFWNSKSVLLLGGKEYKEGNEVEVGKLTKVKLESLIKSKKLVDKIDSATATDLKQKAVGALKKKNTELQREVTELKQKEQAFDSVKESNETLTTENERLKSENEQLKKDLAEATKK